MDAEPSLRQSVKATESAVVGETYSRVDQLSTLSWWRRVFRRAGEEHVNGEAGENPVVFTEVPKPANVPRTATVVEIVLHSGHLVRVPAGVDADTLQQVLQALQTTC